MPTATVRVEVDREAADIYAEASDEDRGKLGALWGALVREYRASPLPLAELMDRIGANAQRRGLTARKLEGILTEWRVPSCRRLSTPGSRCSGWRGGPAARR
jgi:hypothetical protein